MRNLRLTLLHRALMISVLLGASASAQLSFNAPIVTSNSAAGPGQLRPLVGLNVIVFYKKMGDPSSTLVQWETTDSAGQIQIPQGYVPDAAQIYGLNSSLLSIYRANSTIGNCKVLAPVIQYYPVDYSVNSINLDITTLVGPARPTQSECNAYYHLHEAHRILTALVAPAMPGHFNVIFDSSSGSSNYTAHYRWRAPSCPTPLDQIEIAVSGTNAANDTPAARSITTMAHEYAHRIIHHAGANRIIPLPGYMNEGLSDFLASIVADEVSGGGIVGNSWTNAGSNLIGYGVPSPTTAYRNIQNTAQYVAFPTAEKHTAGLVIAGAMYDCRQLFKAQGLQATFDSYIGPILTSNVYDEPGVYCHLLHLDDDDNDLSNGTPNQALIQQAFATNHGIPLPASLCPVSAQGNVASVPAGWSAPGTAAPVLAAVLRSSSTQLDLQVTSGRANAVCALMISLAPPSPIQVAPGLTIFHDFSSAAPPLYFLTDAAGSLALTAPLNLPLPNFALSAAIASPGAPYGYDVSNGVLVRP